MREQGEYARGPFSYRSSSDCTPSFDHYGTSCVAISLVLWSTESLFTRFLYCRHHRLLSSTCMTGGATIGWGVELSWNAHFLPISYGILSSTLNSALHLFGYRESDGAILDTSIGFPSIRRSAKDHIRLECSTGVVRRLSHRACFVSTQCPAYSPTIHSETETEAENQAK